MAATRSTAAIRRFAPSRRRTSGRPSRPATVKSAMSGVSVAVPMPVGGDRRRRCRRLCLGRAARSGRAGRRPQGDRGAHAAPYPRTVTHLDAQEIATFVVDLQRRVLDPEAVVQHDSSRSMRAAVAVVLDAPTSTCADSAGKPEVTSQTCRSWTSSLDAGARAIIAEPAPPCRSTRDALQELLRPARDLRRRRRAESSLPPALRSATRERNSRCPSPGRARPCARP